MGSGGQNVLCGCVICWTCLLWVAFLGAGIASWSVPEAVRDAILDAIEDGLIMDSSDQRDNEDNYKYFKSNNHHDSPKTVQKFYYFEVANVEEVMESPTGTVVPKLNKRGPYAFRKYYDYTDFTFSNNDEQMSWFEYQWWEWDAAESCSGCSMNDEITQINQVFNTLFVMGKDMDESNGLNITAGGYPGATSLVTQVTLLMHAMAGQWTGPTGVNAVLEGIKSTLTPSADPASTYAQVAGLQSMLAFADDAGLLQVLQPEQIYFETKTAKDWFFGYNSTILEALWALEDYLADNYPVVVPNPAGTPPTITISGLQCELALGMPCNLGLKATLMDLGVEEPLVQIYFNGTLEENQVKWENKRDKKYTGKSDKSKILEFIERQSNTQSEEDWWPPYVNENGQTVNASWVWDGVKSVEQMGVGNAALQNGDIITFWVAEVRRYVDFQFKENVKMGKVELKRYEIADHEFLSARDYATNARWQQHGRRGIVNVTSVRSGQPTFLSVPGFQKSEYEFYNGFYNLARGDPADIAYADFEPEFGIGFRGHKTIQYNFVAMADPTCAFPLCAPDGSNSPNCNPVVYCFRQNSWAVNTMNVSQYDPAYNAQETFWAPGVLVPAAAIIDDMGATQENIDDWEKYVIDLRNAMDDWEDYGWVGIVVGLLFICCQVAAIYMCIQNSAAEKAVGGGTADDYTFR